MIKVGIHVKRDVTYVGVLWSYVMKRDGGGWVGQKRVILVWRNYWTVPWQLKSDFFRVLDEYLLRCMRKKTLKIHSSSLVW